MKYNQYKIKAHVWLYPGNAGWHFMTIPVDIAEDINKNFGDFKRAWGSIPVIATIGNSTWKTSIFPDKESGSYLLPVKAEVRKKEKVVTDHKVDLVLEIKIH